MIAWSGECMISVANWFVVRLTTCAAGQRWPPPTNLVERYASAADAPWPRQQALVRPWLVRSGHCRSWSLVGDINRAPPRALRFFPPHCDISALGCPKKSSGTRSCDAVRSICVAKIPARRDHCGIRSPGNVEARDGLQTGDHLTNGIGTHHDRLPGEDYSGVSRPVRHNTVNGSVGGGHCRPSLVRSYQVPRGRNDINTGLAAS
jgi:hypothetical protein